MQTNNIIRDFKRSYSSSSSSSRESSPVRRKTGGETPPNSPQLPQRQQAYAQYLEHDYAQQQQSITQATASIPVQGYGNLSLYSNEIIEIFGSSQDRNQPQLPVAQAAASIPVPQNALIQRSPEIYDQQQLIFKEMSDAFDKLEEKIIPKKASGHNKNFKLYDAFMKKQILVYGQLVLRRANKKQKSCFIDNILTFFKEKKYEFEKHNTNSMSNDEEAKEKISQKMIALTKPTSASEFSSSLDRKISKYKKEMLDLFPKNSDDDSKPAAKKST